MFSCEFCEIYKNTFFTGHLWTTASEFVTEMLIFRSSRSQMFFKIGVLKNFSISEPLPNKVAGLFYRTHTLVASGFLRQAILFLQLNMLFIADSHTGFCSRLFWKHELNLKSSLGVLIKFVNFTGKHLFWSLFVIELQTFRPSILLKRDCNKDVFLRNLRNFYEHLIWSLRTTALKPVLSPGLPFLITNISGWN